MQNKTEIMPFSVPDPNANHTPNLACQKCDKKQI